MDAVAILEGPWRDPVQAGRAFADEPFTLLLLSDGKGWSYLARRPLATLMATAAEGDDPFKRLAGLIGPARPGWDDGPPFQGGVAGLAAYDLGAFAEGIDLPRDPRWPDLACGAYPAVLAFDECRRRVLAVGRGGDDTEARNRAAQALGWLDAAGPATSQSILAARFLGEPPDRYQAAAAQVVERILAGELFQANIARRWTGRLADGARPYDLFERLAGASPAPFAAYLRLPGRALVSNAPERFLSLAPGEGGQVLAQPIKGTRPRAADPTLDANLAQVLLASAKDRAENLMIVDLMRNDLSRVCVPGGVQTPALCALQSFANVHHLVSTVTGRLRPGLGAADLLAAAFPPGSITGAPKVQAMKVIAELEGARGPFFGSIFWAGYDGAMDSSVLIRTAAFEQTPAGDWDLEVRAGGGIVADSDPAAERAETEDKIEALRRALTEPGS